MIHLSASPEQLEPAGREWLERDRTQSHYFYACDIRDREHEAIKRGADAAYDYLVNRHKRKPLRVQESKPGFRGIGWYLAWPFAVLCGFIPLVPEPPHENEQV